MPKLCLSKEVTLLVLEILAPLSMGFSRQEYKRGLPFPSPCDLPNPGIKPVSPALHTDSLGTKPLGKPLTSFSCFILLPQPAVTLIKQKVHTDCNLKDKIHSPINKGGFWNIQVS